MPFDQVLGELGEKPRGKVALGAAEQPPLAGAGHRQVLAGPGDADVTEAPLLFLLALLERALMRKDAFLEADDEDGVVLEALGVVERHQRHQWLGVGEVVLVGVERDLLEELLERRELLVALERPVGVELAGDADQLFEVLDPPLGLDRALGAQRFEIAGLLEQVLEQLGDGGLLGLRPQVVERVAEARDRAQRRGAHARHALGVPRGVPDRVAGRVGVGEQPALAGVADPAARGVDHPREADLVGRVDQQVEVGDGVLDLGALVELGPADHLVGHLVADERVLQDPALRVGPVEDRDLVPRRAPPRSRGARSPRRGSGPRRARRRARRS